jgi:hypothetical protein
MLVEVDEPALYEFMQFSVPKEPEGRFSSHFACNENTPRCTESGWAQCKVGCIASRGTHPRAFHARVHLAAEQYSTWPCVM